MRVGYYNKDHQLQLMEANYTDTHVLTYSCDEWHLLAFILNDSGLIVASPSLNYVPNSDTNLNIGELLIMNKPEVCLCRLENFFRKPGNYTVNLNGKFFNPLGSGGGNTSENTDVNDGVLDGNLANYTSLEDYLNFAYTIYGGQHFSWQFQNTTPYNSGDYVRLHAQNVSGDWYTKATDFPETNVYLNFNETDDFFPQCVVEANMGGETNFWLFEWLGDNLHPSTVQAISFTSAMQGATSNTKGKYYIENGYVRMQVETGYIFPIRISKVSPSFISGL